MRSSMICQRKSWDPAPTDSLWRSWKVGRLHGQRTTLTRAWQLKLSACDEVIVDDSDTPSATTGAVTEEA